MHYLRLCMYMGIAETEMEKLVKIKTIFWGKLLFFSHHKGPKFKKILWFRLFENIALRFQTVFER
jgi:hypothetical protein